MRKAFTGSWPSESQCHFSRRHNLIDDGPYMTNTYIAQVFLGIPFLTYTNPYLPHRAKEQRSCLWLVYEDTFRSPRLACVLPRWLKKGLVILSADRANANPQPGAGLEQARCSSCLQQTGSTAQPCQQPEPAAPHPTPAPFQTLNKPDSALMLRSGGEACRGSTKRRIF